MYLNYFPYNNYTHQHQVLSNNHILHRLHQQKQLDKQEKIENTLRSFEWLSKENNEINRQLIAMKMRLKAVGYRDLYNHLTGQFGDEFLNEEIELENAKNGDDISLEDLVITEVPKSGWSVASHDCESVALDLELTPQLIAAGQVREAIRAIQEGRKSAGFEITDRIDVKWNAQPDMLSAIENELEHIKREVLAIEMLIDDSLLTDTETGFTFNLTKH